MTAPDQTRSLTADSFAPGGYDGPPLPDPLPPTHGEPVLDPITGQREPIRYVPAGNQMIPMTAAQIADLVRLHQPTTPTPTPKRGMDRTAQILLASTPASVAAGWATGHVLQIGSGAGITTGGIVAAAVAVIAWKLPSMGRKTTNITNNIHNTTTVNATNNSKWFGRSTTSTTTNTHK
ncbi:hypothetical protein ACFYXD_35150 [Streptomyces platensis]|uniref:hypothetical protein n=1 Tax=Streptomyces platensis TaxID=58346 RepID=UPI0036A29FB4